MQSLWVLHLKREEKTCKMGPLQAMLLWFFMFWTHSILKLSLLWALIQINPLLQATARTLGKKEVQFWWVTANPGKWEQYSMFFSHNRQMFSFLSEWTVNQLRYEQAKCTAPNNNKHHQKKKNNTKQRTRGGIWMPLHHNFKHLAPGSNPIHVTYCSDAPYSH